MEHDELEFVFEDGGQLKLQWMDGKMSIHLQAFHPGGLRKATGSTVLVDESKTQRIVEWLAAMSHPEEKTPA